MNESMIQAGYCTMGTLKHQKVLWKPGTVLYPLPVVLVTCADGRGNANVLTIAWTGTACTEPPMTYISVRPERHSFGMISDTGEFVINLATRSMAFAVDLCGVKSGRDIDKFRAAGLTTFPAKTVRPPLIAESPVNIECRVNRVIPLGSHHMFIADVTAVHADRSYMDDRGAFNLQSADPLCYSHGKYYVLGKELGRFGFSVRKKGTKKRRPK